MATFNSSDLLQSLTKDVLSIQQQLPALRSLSPADMNKQPAPGKWSIAQVLEHLNSYNRFYLLHLDRVMKHSMLPKEERFNSGFIGNYFTNMMLPKGGKVGNKMSAPKDHTPAPALDGQAVLQEFSEGTEQLLKLLQVAQNKNINKLKVPITISRLVRLKVGDTFRFLIAHQQRHFVQINNVMSALQVSIDKIGKVA